MSGFGRTILLLSLLGCERAVVAPPPADLVMTGVTGLTTQVVAIGATVPIAPSVRVTNAAGLAVSGVTVLFYASVGPGVVTGEQDTTDTNGIASVGSWTVGTKSGAYRLNAILPLTTIDTRVVFSATVTPGPAVGIAIAPVAVSLAPGATRSLIVSTIDQYDNVVTGGVAASFTSGNPAVVTVSPSGVVAAVGAGLTGITASFAGFTRDAWTAVGFRPAGEVPTVTEVNGSPFALAIGSTGVAYLSYGSWLQRFDLPSENSGPLIFGFSQVEAIAFVPNGSRAYLVSSGDGTVSVMDVATSTVVRTINGIASPTRVLAAPDGLNVYVTTAAGRLHRINTSTDAVTTLTLAGVLNGLTFHPSGKTLFVSSSAGGIWDIDLTTFTVRRNVNLSIEARGMAVSLDGTRLHVANLRGLLEVVKTATLARIGQVAGVGAVFEIAMTRDASELYAVQSSVGQTMVIDANTYAVRRVIPGYGPRWIAFNASGTIGMIANGNLTVTFAK